MHRVLQFPITTMSDSEGSAVEIPAPVEVLYCGVCKFPVEYCEFGKGKKKCKAWLEASHPDLVAKYYPECEEPEQGDGTTAEATASMEALTVSDSAEGEAKSSKKKEKKAAPADVVTVELNQRSKRKFVTIVRGLEKFEKDGDPISLGDAAKIFKNKMAAGASVGKNAAGGHEIIIQGDFKYDVLVMLDEVFGIDEDSIKDLGTTKKK